MIIGANNLLVQKLTSMCKMTVKLTMYMNSGCIIGPIKGKFCLENWLNCLIFHINNPVQS